MEGAEELQKDARNVGEEAQKMCRVGAGELQKRNRKESDDMAEYSPCCVKEKRCEKRAEDLQRTCRKKVPGTSRKSEEKRQKWK